MSLCGGGGGGVDGSSWSSGVGDTDRSIVYKCGEGGLYGSGWFFILGEIFLVEVVEEVELVGRGDGGVVKLVLWCANGRGGFLCRFSLMLVEVSGVGVSVSTCLFGMLIWVDCFAILECNFLVKMVGADAVMEVVVEVVVVETVDVVQAGFLAFFRRGCLGNMMGARMVIEIVVGVVVLVRWIWSVVQEWVWELVVKAIEERVW